MVPADWQHPKDHRGHLRPLHDGYNAAVAEWDEGHAKWNLGLRRDWSGGGWKSLDGSESSYSEWVGERPRKADYMPDWPKEQRTHLMMYETCTEGTPISPAFQTPEECARWLADNGASAFGDSTASYEAWLNTCRRGWAASAFIIPGRGIVSGVEASRGA